MLFLYFFHTVLCILWFESTFMVWKASCYFSICCRVSTVIYQFHSLIRNTGCLHLPLPQQKSSQIVFFFPEFLHQCALTVLIHFMPMFATIFFPSFAILVNAKFKKHALSVVSNIHNNSIILWIPYWLSIACVNAFYHPKLKWFLKEKLRL